MNLAIIIVLPPNCPKSPLQQKQTKHSSALFGQLFYKSLIEKTISLIHHFCSLLNKVTLTNFDGF